MKEEIRIENLNAGYGGHMIIENMNLSIPKGKITMLIGPNGCGKSTLLKTIGRILPPMTGQISVQGMDIKKTSTKELARKMAVLPQGPAVPQGLLVKELAAYGRFPYQKPMGGLKEDDLQIISWALEATGLTEYAHCRVDALSGGQRQRAFIAMVLAQETEVMVLDEPTTYLDMAHQIEILGLLRKINEEKKATIVVVLHELNNAAKFADHLVGMKDGKVVFEGTPAEAITRENLEILYGISAELQINETKGYPVCVDYELISK